MITHAESTTLLDSTMDVLESDLNQESSQSGKEVIDEWLAQLNQAENATEIVDTLEKVKNQVASKEADTKQLSDLLNTLATQTVEFSTRMGSEGDIAPRLEGLASALRTIAGQLNHA
ncbi:hypothetical protein GCM10028805_38370 [Spirosoma harenae]